MDAHTIGGRVARALVLAVATAACWWVWLAWDHTYYVDASGAPGGPYEWWQVAGCVLTLVGLGIAGGLRLPGWIVVPTMTVSFTLAWSATASAADTTGLWALGAMLVALGMLLGSTLVALLMAPVRWARKLS